MHFYGDDLWLGMEGRGRSFSKSASYSPIDFPPHSLTLHPLPVFFPCKDTINIKIIFYIFIFY